MMVAVRIVSLSYMAWLLRKDVASDSQVAKAPSLLILINRPDRVMFIAALKFAGKFHVRGRAIYPATTHPDSGSPAGFTTPSRIHPGIVAAPSLNSAN